MIYTYPTRWVLRMPLSRPGCAGPCTPRLAPRLSLVASLFRPADAPPAGRHRRTRWTHTSSTVERLRKVCGLEPWRPRNAPEPQISPELVPA